MRNPCFKIPAKFVDLEPCQSNIRSPSPNLLHAGKAFQFSASSCLCVLVRSQEPKVLKRSHLSTLNACSIRALNPWVAPWVSLA